MELTPLLLELIELQGSDLFISQGAPPVIKVEGESQPIGDAELSSQETHQLAYSIMNDDQIKTFEQEMELNMALHLPDAGRFRVNVFRQRGEIALVIRYIKSSIPTLRTLGLPTKLEDVIMEMRGLVLVVGGTGTGKSTTLASMIDYRARNSTGHILSIEDPIEFIHSHSKSLVNQREVGMDTHSYANALLNAMREAPDVILIGEIRDKDTMKHALAYAETGHLCVSTLHANNADQALDRALNFFPDSSHAQILMDISLHLKAIISQRLCVGTDGKRVAAVEMMFNTPFISSLIQKGKVDEIKEAMGQANSVHQTFDQALYDLCYAGKITQDEALRHADSRNNMSLKFRLNKDHFNTPVTPVKKEVSFNKKAPFEQYLSFNVKPLKASRARREDVVDVINEALIHVFQNKGMTVSSEPDIEIQYVFGLENKDDLSLADIGNESDVITDISPDTDQQATLIINVRDLKANCDVWRLNASRKVSGPLMSQQQINSELDNILADYPPSE